MILYGCIGGGAGICHEGATNNYSSSQLNELAHKFAPAFFLHPQERYNPSSGEWFIDRVGLKVLKKIETGYFSKVWVNKTIVAPGDLSVGNLLTYKGVADGIPYDSSGNEQSYLQLFLGDTNNAQWDATAAGNLESTVCYSRPHVVTKSNGVRYIDIPYVLFFPYNGAPEGGRYKDWWTGVEPEIGFDARRFEELEFHVSPDPKVPFENLCYLGDEI